MCVCVCARACVIVHIDVPCVLCECSASPTASHIPAASPTHMTRVILCVGVVDDVRAESAFRLSGYKCVCLQMAPRSPSRYRRQSTPGGHRLSHGLHSVPSTLSLRPREMTDSTFQLHLQLQHFYYSPIHSRSHSPNRLDPGWSETSFADSASAFGRKYSSIESSD